MQELIELLEAAKNLQAFNGRAVNKGLEKLKPSELTVLKEMVLKFHGKLELNSHLYVGKRVQDGVIAGLKTKDGNLERVLIDGADTHEWVAVEDVKL